MCRFVRVIVECEAMTMQGRRVSSEVGASHAGVVSWGFMSTCGHFEWIDQLVIEATVYSVLGALLE